MIFVTVGNARQGFLRLLNAVESLAGAGAFADEPVIIQSGNNPDFKPIHCQSRPFMGMDEFTATVLRAKLVICHAGSGTLIHMLRAGKVPVVMPRRALYDELIDDHQVELVEALSAEGLIVPAYEAADLQHAVQEALGRPLFPAQTGASATFLKIGEAMDNLLRKRV